MLTLLTNMNIRMEQYEKRLDERNDSASTHVPYIVPPESSTCRATVEGGFARHPAAADPEGYTDVSEAVRTRVASHLRGASAPFDFADNVFVSKDEEPLSSHKKRGLKSGKVKTTDAMVMKRGVWPHEVVYTSEEQQPVYSVMSIALFINGYLTVLAEEAEDKKAFLLQHLQALMEDSEIYSRRAVDDYHVSWLQQIEQGHDSRRDSDKKTKFRRTLVWNRPVPSPKSSMNSPILFRHTTQASRDRGKGGYFSLPSKPGDRACQAFNQGTCKDNSYHPHRSTCL